ncbi:sulfatase-like hydrolase/transferase [Akkermansiaceae bacterium]|nr:sulfatase-like hydrolase/transferase [Akkermansiaceae bacterium]
MKTKRILFATASLALLTANISAQNDLSQKPNIVFLMTDDQRWDTVGCYSDRPDIVTPHIDKLAEQGATFDNAYHAVAICMPSRTTIFTGRYFSDHQVGFTYPYNRTLPKEEFAKSYPAVLKKAGYRTGFVGKFGVRLEDLPKTVAEHFDYYTGISTTSKDGPHFPEDDKKLQEIYSKDRDPKERTLIKGDSMIHFLDTQPKGQPFCLSVSFDAVKNDKDRDMYGPHVELFEGKEMWIPENWVEGKNTKLPKVLDHCRGIPYHKTRTSTPELYQTLARRFAVQAYTVDTQVGRLVTKLEEMGVMDNTIIIYTSDNGRYHGSHGIYDKAILYDEAVKQPLVIFDGRANQENQGHRIDAMVSSADVAPTILSLTGLTPPTAMQGHDLSKLLNQSQDMATWREAVLIENLFIQEIFKANKDRKLSADTLNKDIIENNRSYRSRGVRTERYKYFKYFEHNPLLEELYDLEKDPLEQDNLASNPEYAPILEKLRQHTESIHDQALGN